MILLIETEDLVDDSHSYLTCNCVLYIVLRELLILWWLTENWQVETFCCAAAAALGQILSELKTDKRPSCCCAAPHNVSHWSNDVINKEEEMNSKVSLRNCDTVIDHIVD